eukprot:CAMPEP_0206527794 /NCGR_PEP_ID=MMETSP0325_2-20121206/1562_1 /ASSEMBLY_ACC=CAM_ASM_000347 /TAXON_ID=2866 /ORGANISM="Crypthecodinium cohnii, Strain Seligo" /LENGTH=71 /DNA_ID=CAMNT_0054023275 /DNA_START=684 /DNA_END=899 /DNA_ORIENTATION=-
MPLVVEAKSHELRRAEEECAAAVVEMIPDSAQQTPLTIFQLGRRHDVLNILQHDHLLDVLQAQEELGHAIV